MGKNCVICGKDVTQIKRVKDPQGRYYCAPCYDTAMAQSPAAPAAAPQPDAPADDPYELKDAPKAAAAEVAKSACSGCKAILPAERLRFVDGAFYCVTCLAKQQNAKSTKRKAEAKEDEFAPASSHFMSTLPGIFVTAGVSLLGSWLILSALIFGNGVWGGTSLLFAGIAGILGVVYVVILAAILLGSMLIADRIFGGLGFGTVSDVIWKSMAIITTSAAIGVLAQTNETIAMLRLAFEPIAIVLGLILLFKIDMFEAFVLSAINFVVGWIAMLAVVMLAAMFVANGSEKPESEGGTPTKRVRPDQAPPAAPPMPVH